MGIPLLILPANRGSKVGIPLLTVRQCRMHSVRIFRYGRLTQKLRGTSRKRNLLDNRFGGEDSKADCQTSHVSVFLNLKTRGGRTPERTRCEKGRSGHMAGPKSGRAHGR